MSSLVTAIIYFQFFHSAVSFTIVFFLLSYIGLLGKVNHGLDLDLVAIVNTSVIYPRKCQGNEDMIQVSSIGPVVVVQEVV